MNAWEALGLPTCLALESEEVEAAFRKASEGQHPDAGGQAGEFERLREARDFLKDDFRRLELWLQVQGVAVAHSGAVSDEVGAMFGRVNEVTSGVDDWLAKGQGVSSGLGKALWQKDGFAWKVRLEELTGELEQWQRRVVDEFPRWEKEFVEGQAEGVLSARAELGFLRKWKQQLQVRYGRLWEGLV
jgi:hypothetical protein